MKRKRDESKAGNLFTAADSKILHPRIREYLTTHVVPQSARLQKSGKYKTFTYTNPHTHCEVSGAGGLHLHMFEKYHPHFDLKKAKYNTKVKNKKVKHVRSSDARNFKTSTAREGSLVDKQLTDIISGQRSLKKLNPKTQALLDYLKEHGHVLQAAQVPVIIPGAGSRMTKCDLLTFHVETRELHCWEVKCGNPPGLTVAHGNLQADPFKHVECTILNLWFLQAYLTTKALRENGKIPIARYHVVQLREFRDTPGKIDVHVRPLPDWLK